MATVSCNDNVRLIVSDVDETIADLYTDADPALVRELEVLLREDRALVLISGQGVQNIEERILRHLEKTLRRRILIGHCSGAELWGFDALGQRHPQPYYSHYNHLLSPEDKKRWRQAIHRFIREFRLRPFPTMPIAEFEAAAGDDPLAIMIEDRGPQITFEVVNGYDLSPEACRRISADRNIDLKCRDLRTAIIDRATVLFEKDALPITARLAGVFALDFAIKGVSKITVVRYLLQADHLLHELGLTRDTVKDPANIEVWGDKFSVTQGGTDRHMSEALPKEVRSISFRDEDPREFLPGYNIVVWDGQEHLHKGLLEFLERR